MARPAKLGRVDSVPAVIFRVSKAERDGFQADADRVKCSVNELCRRRSNKLADDGTPLVPPPQPTAAKAGYEVVYDE